MGWLDDAEFQDCFAAAGLVIFPSDFEGFGLPAIEAMRLGIPVVVSDDPALAEVTGGTPRSRASTTPDGLAAAISEALGFTPEQLDAGRRFTDGFAWRRTATVVRSSLTRSGRLTDRGSGRRTRRVVRSRSRSTSTMWPTRSANDVVARHPIAAAAGSGSATSTAVSAGRMRSGSETTYAAGSSMPAAANAAASRSDSRCAVPVPIARSCGSSAPTIRVIAST